MKKKKSDSSNVLIRSDHNLLGLGLFGIVVLFSAMYIAPNIIVNVRDQPSVTVREYVPQNIEDGFAADEVTYPIEEDVLDSGMDEQPVETTPPDFY